MGLYFEEYVDLGVGHTWVSPGRTVAEADVNLFAGLTGDIHPQHTDAEYGKASPYGERIAHGYFTASLASGLAYRIGLDEGTSHAVLSTSWRFPAPVKFGDTLRVVVTLTEARPSKKHPEMGIIARRYDVENQRREIVAVGEIAIMCKRRPAR